MTAMSRPAETSVASVFQETFICSESTTTIGELGSPDFDETSS
jgi:hypothetical protein